MQRSPSADRWVWTRDRTPYGLTSTMRSHPDLPAPSGSVMFLHGWGSPPPRYVGLLGRLVEAGHTILAPALPGFAGSAAGTAPPHLLAAGRANHLLTTAGFTRTTVIAHSFGSAAAIMLALARPDLVTKVVLVCPVGERTGQPTIWSMPRNVVKDGGVAVNAIRTFNTLGHAARHPAQYVRTARAARTITLREHVTDLASRIPLTILNAAQDGVVAPFTPAGADVHTLPGGHRLPLTDPGPVLAHILGVQPGAPPHDLNLTDQALPA